MSRALVHRRRRRAGAGARGDRGHRRRLRPHGPGAARAGRRGADDPEVERVYGELVQSFVDATAHHIEAEIEAGRVLPLDAARDREGARVDDGALPEPARSGASPPTPRETVAEHADDDLDARALRQADRASRARAQSTRRRPRRRPRARRAGAPRRSGSERRRGEASRRQSARSATTPRRQPRAGAGALPERSAYAAPAPIARSRAPSAGREARGAAGRPADAARASGCATRPGARTQRGADGDPPVRRIGLRARLPRLHGHSVLEVAAVREDHGDARRRRPPRRPRGRARSRRAG